MENFLMMIAEKSITIAVLLTALWIIRKDLLAAHAETRKSYQDCIDKLLKLLDEDE